MNRVARIEMVQSGGPVWRRMSGACFDGILRIFFELANAVYHIVKVLIKCAPLLAIMALCLFEFVLRRQSETFQEFRAAFLFLNWMLLVCLIIWCGTFLLLTFYLNDLPVIGLILVAVVAYFVGYADWPVTDALTLLFGVTLGKGAKFLLNEHRKWKLGDDGNNSESERRKAENGEIPETGSQEPEVRTALQIGNRKSEILSFLVCMALLLAFASWWHLDMTDNFYHGPRWMGLWNNPDAYGMLMGAGFVLTIGLLAEVRGAPAFALLRRDREFGARNSFRAFSRRLLPIIVFIAAGMMAVGLLFSYSRGAWLGTAIGLLYLAKQMKSRKQKLEIRNLIGSGKAFLCSAFCFLLLLFGVWFFWNTPRTAPWYWQRLDLSRGSVQHRLAAWKAGFEIMWDHPLGVGWNKTVDVYAKDYSPPEGGAGAITTNDYLMLGTQLGWPGLICFVAYVGLCYRKCGVRSAECGTKQFKIPNSEFRIKTACRAGALAMLVAFWFDGGLFKLATAAVFWILLELGTENRKAESRKAETAQPSATGTRQSTVENQKSEINLSLVTSAATKADAAFTLVEMLVVIAVIGILAALLLPALSAAKRKALDTQCLNNLGELAVAGTSYSHDHDKTVAYTDDLGIPKAGDVWLAPLSQYYAKVNALRLCPFASRVATNTYWYAKDMDSAWLFRSPVDPNRTYSGSYAMNGWLYTGLPDPSGYYFQKFSAVRNPSTTPFFCDSIWVDVWPDEKSGPAVDLTRGALTPDIGRITIARHDIPPGKVPRKMTGTAPLPGFINISFMDGHAERASLEKLWSFTWHKDWATPKVRPAAVGQPPPWPPKP